MHTIATSSPVAVRSFRGSALQSQPPADTAKQRELDLWVKRYQPELGLLQSPPSGPGGPKAKDAQSYVGNLVQQLAGERLKKDGLDLRVELFSGDVAQAGLDDSTAQEEAWQEAHPEGKPWPIRTWLEAPKQGSKPLYRLALSQGLLETLKTKEELGFVVAHQLQILLAHNTADPNNEDELSIGNQSFLDTRQAQLANDSAALKMMTDAGLNPKGALGAVDKLYKKFPLRYSSVDQKAALGAAAQIQEHEGIRTSALQLQIEQLRRQGHFSTHNPLSDIPETVVAPATGNYDGKLENFGAFQSAINNAAQGLATEETPDWMFGDRSEAPALELLKVLRPNSGEYERALLGVCDHLSLTTANPQHRVNGFLRLAIALDGECFPPGFSAEGREKIREFLTVNSAWSADAFLGSLEKNGKSLHRELARNLQLTDTFQSITAPLAQQGSQMGRLAQSAPANACRDPETGAFEMEALPTFLKRNNDDDHDGLALAKLYNESSLSLLNAQDPQMLAKELDELGLPRGLGLGNDMRRIDNLDPEYAARLRETMKPIENASFAAREDNARMRLRPPLAEPMKLGAYLQEFFASELGGEFSSQFEGQLPALLLDVVRTCNHQPDLLFDSGRPRPPEEGLERRLNKMLAIANPEDREEITRFLARTWSHELRVPTHSERREWTTKGVAEGLAGLEHGELVRQLSTQDTAQHAAFFRKSLMEGYGLMGDALPDVSTASLAALEKRVSAGEFEPKEENYSDPKEYEKAVVAYHAAQEKMQEVSAFLAPAEGRLVLSKLAILGHDPSISLLVTRGREAFQTEQSGRVVEFAAVKGLTGDEFLGILGTAEAAVERSKTVKKVTGATGLEVVGTDAGSFLLDGFLAVEKSFATIDEFYSVAKRTGELSPGALEARSDTRRRMADALFARLDALEKDEDLRAWLGKERVLDTLKPEQTSKLMMKLLGELAKPGSDVAELGRAVKGLDTEFKLKEEHGLAYVMVRDEVTLKSKLQPGNLNKVFPPDETGPVDYLAQFRAQLSGLSGLIAMTRNHSPKEQIAAIEYLMGRSENMPEFLEKASESQSFGPVAQTVRNARAALAESDTPVRVMVANSFLAGPNGLLKTEGGRDAVLEHFLAGVTPKSLPLARPLTQAILISQGDTDSLAVAAVLGQRVKNRNGNTKLTEADILSRVFDSYGVPGVKMKQYLAFTSQFAGYREAFEDAQDASNPLNYYEMLRLIQSRFGDEWPPDLAIDKLLGSGSVNVAIRYTNTTTGKREVVSLGRDHIVEQTGYDFERFNRFVDALTTSPEGKASFGFIKGLTGIIEDSVELEFDKEAAKAVQKEAFETYRHKFADGWTLRSIDAYQVKNLGLFMEEAKGTTARKILSSKPELYKTAMRHVAHAEFNLLKGRDSSNNLVPRPNFANPDIHDGQILIDEETKTATVLDFGQAVPISNKERELALDLLTIIGGATTSGGAAKLLNKRFFPKAKKGEGITKKEIKELRGSAKLMMDKFIRLLSLVAGKGAKVPLSSVHWVLALNRQLVLGEKLDQGVKAQLIGMVVNKRLGLPLTVFNALQQTGATAAQVAGSVISGIAGFVTGWFTDETTKAGAEGELKIKGAVGGLSLWGGKAREPEKAWRDKNSFAFYLDDFAPEESGYEDRAASGSSDLG